MGVYDTKIMMKLSVFIFVVAAFMHHGRAVKVQKMNVIMETHELWSRMDEPSSLKCYYWLDSGDDLPVRIIWKVGDGPRNNKILATCTDFTKQKGKCDQIITNNKDLSVSMKDMMVQLQFDKIQTGDDRNYWCEVQIEDTKHHQLGSDQASTVIRISQQSLPKFHIVITDKSYHQVKLGDDVVLTCTCEGYHCDDVIWYKGPTYNDEYKLVYSKTIGGSSGPNTLQEQAYDGWMGRTSLEGNSLKIEGILPQDNGRYWCEVRSSQFYGIGEWATDASSTTIDIIH